jgi:hypothetical protein
MSFVEYVVKLGVIHEDILDQTIFLSLDGRQKTWVRNCIPPKTISSCANFLKVFSIIGVLPHKGMKMFLESFGAALQNE